jgi:hypothetical protein
MTHKPVDKKFTLKIHTYEQVKREGDIAIYKQYVTEDKSGLRYEVVRIGRHNGYTLAGNTIAPAETYPGATQWGINGFTCLTLADAEKRFKRMQGEEVETEVEVKTTGKAQRGKKKVEVQINIPKGKFSAKEFAEACHVDYALGSLRMKELLKKGEIKFVEEKRINPRGKATKFYVKI